MGFEQAAIKVEKEQEFGELKGAIERSLAPEKAERFLRQVRSHGLRVRDLDGVLAKGLIQKVDERLAKSGRTALQLYQELAIPDQAQMREFYLSKLETVDSALRHKFKKLYQYY
jgi:hypothetical protein